MRGLVDLATGAQVETGPAALPEDGLRWQLELGTARRRRKIVLGTGSLADLLAAERTLELPSGVVLELVPAAFGGGLHRLRLTLWNPRAARHRRNLWDLGDPGSFRFRDLRLRLCGRAPGEASFQLRPGEPFRGCRSFALHQSSSGLANWHHPVDRDAAGRIPTLFRGFRCEVDGGIGGMAGIEEGLQAQPALRLRLDEGVLTVCLESFWQTYPKAVQASPKGLAVALFPREAEQLFELQGGEKSTHVLWLHWLPEPGLEPALESDGAANDLDFARLPVAVLPPPAALPALAPLVRPVSPACPACPACPAGPSGEEAARDRWFLEYLGGLLDGPRSLWRRREEFAEFGWRNFGEVPADHEGRHYRGALPLVSHYNNQYDCILGFLQAWAATGEGGWWRLARELADHVLDHDLYHTDRDRSVYNGGYFWHSPHYAHAGTATHRCYSRRSFENGPPRPGFGGGPSDEHDYSTGLACLYLLTGDVRARDAVLQLARWVRGMHDGARTPLRWLSRAPTGRATCTRTLDYQGPGRGAGYSVNTLLDAWLLSGDEQHLDLAEELLRAVVHPADDPQRLRLLDRETRWSYVVFLEVLAKYLDLKEELGRDDEAYQYARSTLLAYARWMAEHEGAYLDRPEDLEYPTSTWAAQELRKVHVFLDAARYADPGRPDERERFLAKAREFESHFRRHLETFDDQDSARNAALILTHQPWILHVRARGLEPARLPLRALHPTELAPRPALVPQKVIAKRRLAWLAGSAVSLGVLAVSGLLLAGRGLSSSQAFPASRSPAPP